MRAKNGLVDHVVGGIERQQTLMETRNTTCIAPAPPEAPDWNRLLAEVRPLVLQVALQDLRLSSEDSEDIFQLVSLKLYGSWEGLQSPAAMPAWVRTVTRRTALDHLRARKQTLSLDSLEREPADAGAWVDRVEARADLERALQAVSEQYHEPLFLFYVLGYSQDEIGRRLNRPRSTVASQISRGLAQLRQALASSPEAEE
jgi:RNA polymerase sigma-70 factor, ECF subfamily